MSSPMTDFTAPESAPLKKPLSRAKPGPRTDAGKQAVSKNALKTGIYAEKWLAVTDDEQSMVNDLIGQLREQFPAENLLDELAHEMFIKAYMQWWRFIQAYGGAMDLRRGEIAREIELDGVTTNLGAIEEQVHWISAALRELKETGRVTGVTLTKVQAVFESSAPAAALIEDLRRIAATTAEPAAAGDVAQAQRLGEALAKELADTKAEVEARIAKQADAAYRRAALPTDAEAKTFLRYERDTFRKLRRAAETIERRWGRAPGLPRRERKAP
jgi:hypothetical protein